MAGGEDGDWWRRQTEEGAPTRVDGGALAINEEGTRAINEGLGQGSFGFVIWDAALSLASFFRWLAARGRLGSGLRCLELGAGTGVPGLTLAQLGAGHDHSGPKGYCHTLLNAKMSTDCTWSSNSSTMRSTRSSSTETSSSMTCTMMRSFLIP